MPHWRSFPAWDIVRARHSAGGTIATVDPPGAREAAGTLRFAVPIVLGAFLLFHVQPIVGRFILPWFGATAAAWSVCLLFFQVGLLAGYAYAHVLSLCAPRTQGAIDLGLTAGALLVLPIIPSEALRPEPGGAPTGQLLIALARTAGLPFFLLASTSPLLQHWRAEASSRSPYRLFSLSNAAALLGLVSYPTLVEPLLGVRAQALAWSVLFAAFAATRGWCAVRVVAGGSSTGASRLPDAPGERTEAADRLTLGRIGLWVVLAGAASAMLLATTNQLSQEVPSVPFLWVFPLTLYLLTFVISFDHARWYDRRVFAPLLAVMAPLVVAAQGIGSDAPIWAQVVTYGGTLFAAGMVCHGELVRARPVPRHLTGFYLAVALGGALGGVAVALVAPVVFRGFWEFPITLVACCLLALLGPVVGPSRVTPSRSDLMRSFVLVLAVLSLAALGAARVGFGGAWRERGTFALVAALCVGVFTVTLILDRNRWRRSLAPVWYQFGLAVGILGLVVSALLLMVDFQRAAIHAERNFYGVLRVREARERLLGPFRLLNHGLTQHGIQYGAARMRRRATAYYGEESGVGLAVRHHPRRSRASGDGAALRIGVVGLGVGTLAAYGRPGDVVRFYEIDPAVVRIAQEYFTYLADSPASVEIVVGDARLRLEDELARGAPQGYDILAVDAFLGDAVPVHLLTRECVAVYRAQLREDGLLALHLSNRLLDFRPVTDALASHFDLAAVEIRSSGSLAEGTRDATWVILGARTNPFFADPAVRRAAVATERERQREGRAAPRLWTDDHSSLWPLLRAGH